MHRIHLYTRRVDMWLDHTNPCHEIRIAGNSMLEKGHLMRHRESKTTNGINQGKGESRKEKG